MIVFLDGQYLPSEQALVSVFDRSFLYGDGLFESVAVFQGNPFRLKAHWERLVRGAEYLRIKLPYSLSAIAGAIEELARRNEMPNALARLTLSRGIGPRGYSPREAISPLLAVSWHPLPLGIGRELPRWRVIRSSQVLPQGQTLTRFKTANRLVAVLARAEAEEAGVEEALVLNHSGRVAEATAANLFWVNQGAVHTPPLHEGALDGITRSVVQELCAAAGLVQQERNVTVPDLLSAEGVFLSLSTWGIVEVSAIDGQPLPSTPVAQQLSQLYWELVGNETQGVPAASVHDDHRLLVKPTNSPKVSPARPPARPRPSSSSSSSKSQFTAPPNGLV